MPPLMCVGDNHQGALLWVRHALNVGGYARARLGWMGGGREEARFPIVCKKMGEGGGGRGRMWQLWGHQPFARTSVGRYLSGTKVWWSAKK